MTEFFPDRTEALDEWMPEFRAALGDRRKIALYGDLGSGKTTLVAAFCRFLNTREAAASPTFSLINEYAYLDEAGAPALLHHVDLYRLRSLQEVLDIGMEDLLYDPWYLLVEWPQLLEPLLPDDVVKVQIEVIAETSRRILIL